MAFQTTDDISGNESDDVGVCRLDDVVAEAGKRHAAGATLVHQGSDARLHTDQVCIEAEGAAYVLKNVCVGVDHPRDNDPTCNIDSFLSVADALADSDDLAVLDSDVHETVEILTWIDNLPAFEDEVRLCVHNKFLLQLYRRETTGVVSGGIKNAVGEAANCRLI